MRCPPAILACCSWPLSHHRATVCSRSPFLHPVPCCLVPSHHGATPSCLFSGTLKHTLMMFSCCLYSAARSLTHWSGNVNGLHCRPKPPTATTKAATKKTFSRARAATNFALMNEPEVPQYDLPEDPGKSWPQPSVGHALHVMLIP